MAQKLVNVPIKVVFGPMHCEWRLTAPVEDAGLAVYTRRITGRGERKFDPWSIRAAFLGFHSTSELTRFLQTTGVFTPYDDNFRNLVEWQRLICKLMTTNPQKWPTLAERFDKRKVTQILRNSTADCSFLWASGKPCARLWASYTLRAMVLSVQVDHLRGAKFRFCMKTDCGKPYEVTSAHARLYCSQECAHHASVRRNRENRRRERQIR
jgi:hypothetical protein